MKSTLQLAVAGLTMMISIVLVIPAKAQTDVT
jgi:hypothetical protein